MLLLSPGVHAGAAEPLRESIPIWQCVNNRCVHLHACPAWVVGFIVIVFRWHAGEEYSVVNFYHCNYGATYHLTENPHYKTPLARMVTPRIHACAQAVRMLAWIYKRL